LFHKINFPGLARISFGIENTEKDIDALIQVLNKLVMENRKSPKSDIKQRMNDYIRAASKRVYKQI
jgi:hypothetical protein